MHVVALVVDAVQDAERFSDFYARLCRKTMEKVSPWVKNESITLQDGKAIAGGQLFRKYLLNLCQKEFEHRCAVREARAAVAEKKTAKGCAVKGLNEMKGSTMFSVSFNEYYAAQKTKRRGLGLIKFLGELFKLQMLTERIMHNCLKALLGNVDPPDEENLESC
ncbi:hypothetical protein C0993_003921, partial [Termitomyces sp. T159_Od127]